MHLTAGEGPLFGAIAGAVATSLVAYMSQAGIRRREHNQRRWERETEAYEHVLYETATLAEARELAGQSQVPGSETPVTGAERVERQQALIRLRIYADDQVNIALKKYIEADLAWWGLLAKLRVLQETNAQVARGDRPPSAAHEGAELVHVRHEVEDGIKKVVALEQEVIRTVRTIVERGPRSVRRYRRLPWQKPTEPPPTV